MKKKITKKSNIITKLKENYKKYLVYLVVIILAILSGAGIDVVIRPNEDGEVILDVGFSMQLASKQQPAILETEEGTEIESEDIVTVEEVDGNQLINECPEGEECGKGAVLPPLDITSPYTFYNSVIDQCIDFDGAYGSQCYDEFAYFHFVYTGHWLSTNGTGAAYGIWDARDYNNPINPETGETYYELITDPTQVRPGDFIVFYGGRYGHTGDAMGYYNNGYVALLGTNQGGRACAGGGSAANVINISMSNFRGAFRPRIWMPKPEPTPTPLPISNCVKWHVERGDTMSKIMLECEGTVIYGKPMDDYAKTWYSLIYKPNQSVYDGWHSKTGVGLYAGDDIEHRLK